MHEVSLVQGLMEQVRNIARNNRASEIIRIKVLIGPFSGVVIDSFEFAFDALKQDDVLFRQCMLEIQAPGPVFQCRKCGAKTAGQGRQANTVDQPGSAVFSWLSHETACPECGEKALTPSGGDEILLMQVEME